MTASDVLHHVGVTNPTNPQARECGQVLRDLYGEPKKSKGLDRWRVPFSDVVVGNTHGFGPSAPAVAQFDDDDRF